MIHEVCVNFAFHLNLNIFFCEMVYLIQVNAVRVESRPSDWPGFSQEKFTDLIVLRKENIEV